MENIESIYKRKTDNELIIAYKKYKDRTCDYKK